MEVKMSVRVLEIKPTFDLSRVLHQIKRDNPGWTEENLEAAKEEYLRFLQLCKSYPDDNISAPATVDVVWHAHMLDSVYYARDCGAYFGYYLHHDPCIGGQDVSSAETTLALYQSSFGVTPPDAWTGLMTCQNPRISFESAQVH